MDPLPPFEFLPILQQLLGAGFFVLIAMAAIG
jgi:hypothetical protein